MATPSVQSQNPGIVDQRCLSPPKSAFLNLSMTDVEELLDVRCKAFNQESRSIQ